MDTWAANVSTLVRGVIDDSGIPKLQIGICKDVHDLPQGNFLGEAYLDTGFTGFAQIPIALARQLDLDVWGTAKVRVADNREVPVQIRQAVVMLNGQPKDGYFYVSETLPVILLGMDFLRIFQCSLVVSASYAYVIPSAHLDPLIEGWKPSK